MARRTTKRKTSAWSFKNASRRLFKKKRKRSKPTSGNISGVKQWFYIYINIPVFFIVKIGVTGYYWTRWKQIALDPKNFGIDIPVFGIPIFCAYDLEQINKSICSFLWIRFESFLFRGTGKTERFFILGIIPALILSVSSLIIEWVIVKFSIPLYLIYLWTS